MNANVATQSKRWKENSTGRFSIGSRNQNGKHLVNLFEANILEGQVIFPELVKTLFPVESTNNIKINIIHHRVIGDGCICQGISHMNTCWVSQSVFYQFLNVVSDGVFKRKCLNAEIIFHLKRILKRLCFYKWKA